LGFLQLSLIKEFLKGFPKSIASSNPLPVRLKAEFIHRNFKGLASGKLTQWRLEAIVPKPDHCGYGPSFQPLMYQLLILIFNIQAGLNNF
jgi:hypothetical protein